jgi:hypothetical protein
MQTVLMMMLWLIGDRDGDRGCDPETSFSLTGAKQGGEEGTAGQGAAIGLSAFHGVTLHGVQAHDVYIESSENAGNDGSVVHDGDVIVIIIMIIIIIIIAIVYVVTMMLGSLLGAKRGGEEGGSGEGAAIGAHAPDGVALCVVQDRGEPHARETGSAEVDCGSGSRSTPLWDGEKVWRLCMQWIELGSSRRM